VTKDIAIVIPVYGPGPHLEKVVAELRRQVPPDTRIIISHSGSGDPAARFREQPGVTVLHSRERLFAGAARNRGLALADSEWLAFVDEDVLPAPGWYSALLKIIAAREADCIIGSIGYRESGGYWGISLWYTEFGSVHAYMPARPLTGGPSANMVVRRLPFLQAGAFPEDWRSSEELFAQARLLARGGRMIFEPALLGLHFNQRGARKVLSHLYLYGRYGARLRRAYPALPGASAVRHPVLSTGMWLARLVQMSRRVLLRRHTPKWQFLLHLPGIIICLITWNLSFAQEAFAPAGKSPRK
jgi:glycosyltransferase involved in cell wall biosynthesis